MSRTPAKRSQRPAKPSDGVIGNGSDVAKPDGGTGEQINGSDSIDPAAIGSGAAGNVGGDNDSGGDDGPRQRRTRSDAGGKRGPRKSAPLDLTDLKDILVMAHVAISMAFESGKKMDDRLIPIDETEAEKLAGAVQKVLRHYDLPDVASETKDWIGLIIVAGSIYGPRVAASWANKQTSAAATAKQAREMTVPEGQVP